MSNNSSESVASALPNDRRFPFLDLRAQFATIKGDVIAAVLSVLESQNFILGPEVEGLERDLCRVVGTNFAVGCASGSDALLLALMAIGIEDGDEVITTPFTFVATAGSIARLKARPVFVDIDPETYNIDPKKIKAAITTKTRAILPVHLFGLSADMAPILEVAAEYNLPVIEDAAQALGSSYRGNPVGRLGTIACFSFFPSKNLGGAGDGGMLTTNSAELADRLKLLRLHGSRKKYNYEVIGLNSRLDAIQATILRVKLRHLESWALARQQNADRYRKLFAELDLQRWISPPIAPPGRTHVYNQFVLRAECRDELQRYLYQVGIPTEVYYPSPLHLQPAFGYLGYGNDAFSQAEKISEQVLALPIYPELQEAHQRTVVEAIAEFYHSH